MEDNIIHEPIDGGVTSSLAGDIVREVVDDSTGIRQCTRHSSAIDGGLSRDIATFLYRDVVINDHDRATEKRALGFLSPVGARLYRPSSGAVLRTLYFFQLGKSNQSDEDYCRDKVEPVWTNGFEESRVIILPSPLDLTFYVLCSMVRATIRGAPHFIYPGSIHDSSLVPKEIAHITLDIDLIRLIEDSRRFRKSF